MSSQADARFDWRDPLLLERQLTDDERLVRDAKTVIAALSN